MAPRVTSRALLAALLGAAPFAALVLGAGPATAHKPVFVDRTDATAETGPLLLDGTVSFAVYGTLGAPGDQRWVRARLKAGDRLLVELLIPDQEPERSLPAAALPRVTVRDPKGTTTTVPTTTRRVFREPFSGTSYVCVAAQGGTALAGTYAMGVTGTRAARFTLVVGSRETAGRVQGESPRAPGALAQWWTGPAPG